MGYTTKFEGEFTITPYPTEEFVENLNLFSSKRHDEEQYPGIWCQWIINLNDKLAWNGGEKLWWYIMGSILRRYCHELASLEIKELKRKLFFDFWYREVLSLNI